jgi:protein-L-isoaspartate O-methyltransferase
MPLIENLANIGPVGVPSSCCTNVDIRTGDGTRGLPEAAPFDAILIAAGGPSIPKPLCRQLAGGGRLVMPVGDADLQKLVRATRTADDRYDEEDIGDVRFVPLIGAHGWAEDRGAGVLVEPVPIGGAAANGAARRRRKTYPFGL